MKKIIRKTAVVLLLAMCVLICISFSNMGITRADEDDVIDVSDVPQEESGGGDDGYTPEQKAQAKAWLSAHGYPPTRAGANAAYADFLAGKFNNDPAVMAQARAYGLIPPEDPAVGGEDNSEGEWAQIIVDDEATDGDAEEATPDEPEEATPDEPEEATPDKPVKATPDVPEELPAPAEDSAFIKAMRIVYIAIVAILALIGATALGLHIKNRRN